MNKLAQRLSELLKDKEVTQSELAKHLNVKQQTISKYINGITEPSLDILILIARFFNVSTDSLLGEDDHYYD